MSCSCSCLSFSSSKVIVPRSVALKDCIVGKVARLVLMASPPSNVWATWIWRRQVTKSMGVVNVSVVLVVAVASNNSHPPAAHAVQKNIVHGHSRTRRGKLFCSILERNGSSISRRSKLGAALWLLFHPFHTSYGLPF
jgi:hypothetical protein